MAQEVSLQNTLFQECFQKHFKAEENSNHPVKVQPTPVELIQGQMEKGHKKTILPFTFPRSWQSLW